MGLFDVFNQNKRKWLAVQADADMSQEQKIIIRDFYIQDDIQIEKFIENQRANETTGYDKGGISMWEAYNRISTNPEPPINCTPTFRQHFSNNTLNRGNAIPAWFYIAYPDVAYWFHQNFSKFQDELDSREEELTLDDGINPVFFRELINRYIKINVRLECSRL